eukprot:CAMPEP_0198302188 /NCGR_PEP_ID=MMETSP1449-20131203/54291_1 /TAXON_ID=420275 /ORGANISM="Attheya septentrionalis, Strain CCMP2084" /LENGTH=34 /DNA_ID= /DNA_START= /DNA_END= /DNA_ORIENTATION=
MTRDVNKLTVQNVGLPNSATPTKPPSVDPYGINA